MVRRSRKPRIQRGPGWLYKPSVLIKHRQLFYGSLNPGAGFTQAYTFRNSVYDPDAAASAYPSMRGYAQMAALYQRSMVVHMKVTARFTIASASTTIPMYFYIKRYPFVTGIGPPNTSADMIRDMEVPDRNTKWRIVNQAHDKTVTLSMSASPRKVFKYTNYGDVKDRLAAQNGLIPTDESRMSVGLGTTQGTAAGVVWAQVMLEFTVLWDEKRDIV